MARGKKSPSTREAANYRHPESDMPVRPEVGTQPQFKKSKPAQKYRYDSSLSPALDWDGQNSKRELTEKVLADGLNENKKLVEQLSALKKIKSDSLQEKDSVALKEAIAIMEKALTGNREALDQLKAMSRPFLNWSGKAERLSFDVPTLPLFVHERLSTQAIIETLTGHKQDKQTTMFDLFADPQHSIVSQSLRAYEHGAGALRDKWVNRMILGDGLVVMNSLLHYENMAGQVQMIYIDPPYGVSFGSNFQPFVRKRDVSHGDDEDMTREPEMVQAYRDTWELGLHSYLTYLRDRLLLARELLTSSGSIFVQISDENVHHVRELMDEVFGIENSISLIAFAKTAPLGTTYLPTTHDFLLWYGKDKTQTKYKQVFVSRQERSEQGTFLWIELPDGSSRRLTTRELKGEDPIPKGRRFRAGDLTRMKWSETSSYKFEFDGKIYQPPSTRRWATNLEGMQSLIQRGRIIKNGASLAYKLFEDDFPWTPVSSEWGDTIIGTFTEKLYVVQTSNLVLQRCILMTTDPGDLVLDPTCGSGTTAYVAENWGRRWITADVSRVPLALARQRLLVATYPWFKLKDETRGPVGGFIYERRQNKKGEEVGGIVPHVTLKSIANNEKPGEEVLVDRPEELNSVTRVTGPFVVEASIPTVMEWDGNAGVLGAGSDVAIKASESYGSFSARLLEVLRKSPVLRLDGNRTVTLKNIRPPAKSLTLSAEALVEKPSLTNLADDVSKQPGLQRDGQPVAFVFGPENGAVSEKLVYEAAFEAKAKSYTHIYVVGFAIQPTARELVEKCADVMGIAATYVQATPDLLMGDLLKNMRSSQIFSVCGLPEVNAKSVDAPAHAKKSGEKPAPHFQVELVGLDVFDPVTMEVDHRNGNDVPAWLLDTDYNGRCFHVSQAFFPRTSAWDNLKKSLKGEYDEAVWDHLAGNVSAPFPAGEHKQIAVKVIDDRGNELLVVKKLEGIK